MMNKDLIFAFLLASLLHAGILGLEFSYVPPVFDVVEAPSSLEIHLIARIQQRAATSLHDVPVQEDEASLPEPLSSATEAPDTARDQVLEKEAPSPEPAPLPPESSIEKVDEILLIEPKTDIKTGEKPHLSPEKEHKAEREEHAQSASEPGEEILPPEKHVPGKQTENLLNLPEADEIDTAFFPGAEEMVFPEYLKNPAPVYPERARRRGIEGRIILEVEVTREGKCGMITIVSSTGSPLLDNAALEAVRQWKFSPAKRFGLPAAARVKIPIVFRLE